MHRCNVKDISIVYIKKKSFNYEQLSGVIMKSILLLLTLFSLSPPVLAEPADNNRSFQELHHLHPKVFENTQSQPKSIYDVEPRYLKLIQMIEDKQRIKTIKANLTLRELMRSTA